MLSVLPGAVCKPANWKMSYWTPRAIRFFASTVTAVVSSMFCRLSPLEKVPVPIAVTLRTVSGLFVQIADDAAPDEEEIRATVSRTVYERAGSTNNAAREFGPLE